MGKRKTAAKTDSDAPALVGNQGYTVLARRYRPQRFEDVVGQEPVAKALVNALQSNRVAHAYLFTGARGVGKTSMARILAKALNCEKGPTAEPCNQCDICRAITDGSDLDVVEIDGASNRQIDDIRELRQNVRVKAGRARYRIYIIDEVHMLTKEAFNALLKTLEEPPPHVKFIFATTDVQKVPVTILSRCQRFDFAGIGVPQIIERLKGVVESEGMKADDEALELVARRAGGSMRDAQSLLDQLLAFGGDQLTSDQVHALLGTAPAEKVAELAAAALQHDAKKCLELVDREVQSGRQLGELLDQLIDYWRDLMVVQLAGAQAPDLSVPSRQRATLVEQAKSMPLDTILAGLDILTAAKMRLRGSPHTRVILEAALVRLGRLDDLVALSDLAQWMGGGANPPSGERKSEAPPTMTAARPSLASMAASRSPASEPSSVSAAAGPLVLTEENYPQVWPEIAARLGGTLATAMEKAERVAILAPNTLVVCFGADYNAWRQRCEDPVAVSKIEGALRQLTGKPWQFRVESSGESAPAESAAGNEAAASKFRRVREEATREPLVKRAMELFDAQVTHTDPGFGSSATDD